MKKIYVALSFITISLSRAEIKPGIFSPPSQQEALTISLKEAIPMALKNNVALKVEHLTPSIRQTFEEEQ